MTEPTRVAWNTLEQVISTDLNRMGALAGKAAQAPLSFMAQGFSSLAQVDAVVAGLDLSAGAGLAVELGAGTLIRYDFAATTSSNYEIGHLDAVTTVALTASDVTNPRVDLIYGTPTTVLSD